ncbi:unnamed protein product, partial [Urochloa humidicola]
PPPPPPPAISGTPGGGERRRAATPAAAPNLLTAHEAHREARAQIPPKSPAASCYNYKSHPSASPLTPHAHRQQLTTTTDPPSSGSSSYCYKYKAPAAVARPVMAAVGARPVLYHHHHPAPAPAGDAAAASSAMSSYFSHGGSSTSSSSASASSFSAALGAAPVPPPLPDQFDISEFLFDDGGGAGGAPAPPGVFAAAAPDGGGPPPHGAVPAAGSSISAAAQHAPRGAAEAMPERPRTERIAFRTRSEIEILDDGYKWRKYGKKSVKNSPNPRNYYRCSTEGCNVKKRVERDKDDPSYVVTTYEGTHNHVSPSTVYYASQDAASGRFFVAGTQPPGSIN